ncbi:MAG: site-specific integrase [Oscillospiraceae bacterium]
MAKITIPEPRKLKSGSWFIQLRLGGESVPVTAPTEKECRTTASLIKAQYKAGKRLKSMCNDITLTAAIDNYISSRSNTLSPSTIRGYRTIQRNRFKGSMGKKIKDIGDWQKLCNDEAKLCAAKTLDNSWKFIASVLKENGVKYPKIKLPQIVQTEKPWLEPEEISTFINAIKGKPCEIPALLALHSLRRSEIMAITMDKIDFKKGLIYIQGAVVPDEHHAFVHKETNKNQTSNRVIPIMIPELLTALKALKETSGAVWKGSPNTLGKQINRICVANDLPQVCVHGLRRSFASLGYHLGLSEREVMDIGGWADTQTMHKKYIRLSQRDIQKAENKMSEYYKNSSKNANENANAPKKPSIPNPHKP